MSEHICPVVRLGAPKKIKGADKIEMFDIAGSGPAVVAVGQFGEGELAAFIPPETMVDTSINEFSFLKSKARKSDGWHKISTVRLRGQLSVGLLVSPRGLNEGDNAASAYRVKKIEDIDSGAPTNNRSVDNSVWARIKRFIFGAKVKKKPSPWPWIPVYDINQLYKMPAGIFSDSDLVAVTEKLHGTNARFTIGKDGKMWVGSRNMWCLHDGKNVYSRAAVEHGLEAKLRRLAEPLVLWGEIVGPGIQKGFNYGLAAGQQAFKAFDIYHAGERRFLDSCETKDICHWLGIDFVNILAIDSWGDIADKLLDYVSVVNKRSHPQEGIVVRHWKKSPHEVIALNGSKCLAAGKVINPAYYEFREKK